MSTFQSNSPYGWPQADNSSIWNEPSRYGYSHHGVCPGCGRCYTCGRGGYLAPYDPLWNPGIAWRSATQTAKPLDPRLDPAHVTMAGDSWDLEKGDPIDKEMELDHTWNQWVKNVEPEE